MNAIRVLQFIIILISDVQYFTTAQICDIPTADEVKAEYERINSLSLSPGAIDVFFPCMAQASTFNKYRQVSVIIQYNDGMESVKQFELDCVSGNTWTARGASSVTGVPSSFNYTSANATRADCSSCDNTADNDYHCIACDPACNVGSMRCTAPGPNECCPVFNGQECSMSCPDNFIAAEFNEYNCQQKGCTLPTTTDAIASLLNLLPPATIKNYPHYACMAQGLVEDTYTEATFVLETSILEYYLITCNSNGAWFFNDVNDVPQSPNYRSNIDSRTDCHRCNDFTGSSIFAYGNPCRACPSGCSEGLNRCLPDLTCCVAFEDDGVCKTDLNCNKDNFVANKENNYTCSCGLSSCPDGYTLDSASCTCTLTDICVADDPCNNNGVCILDTAPDQYTCDCTGTGYTGVACTECSLSCPSGYTVDVDCQECLLDDICVAANPCQNRGVCTLDTAPDQYTCNCTGTGYIGVACTECSLSCPSGYTVDVECQECLLDDICVAANPCKNGGVCILDTAPDQYTCNCTGTGYRDTARSNCSECSLECLNGGSVDQHCMSCDCVAGYTGGTCSECDTGYSVDMDGGCTSVNGTSSAGNSSASSFKWWHVGLPIILLVVLLLAIAIIVGGVLLMKNKINKEQA